MALRLRSTITHTLFGVDIHGDAQLPTSGEIPAELLEKVPAADLTRRILSGDYTAMPDEDADPEMPPRVWEPSDLLRAVLKERGITLGAPIAVPEEPVGRSMVGAPEPSVNDDDTDLEESALAAAAAMAEAKLKAAQENPVPDAAEIEERLAAVAEAKAQLAELQAQIAAAKAAGDVPKAKAKGKGKAAAPSA